MKIEISNIIKTFNDIEVLNIPHLSIDTSQIAGFVGNNGSGKTTLFRLVLDLLKAEKGEISIDGKIVNESDKWKEHTGSYLDEKFLIDFLYPEEYFRLIKEAYRISDTDFSTMMDLFQPFMNNEILHKKKLIQSHSKGNKQKIGIIGAMLPQPDILLLDEPFNFLDPSSQIKLKQLLLYYNQNHGTTILLSSHNLQYVMDICSRIIVLDSGYILYDETDITEIDRNKIRNYFSKDTQITSI